MTDIKKQEPVEPDSNLGEEDEATLAAIDRGIKAGDESRVFEEARRRLREWLT